MNSWVTGKGRAAVFLGFTFVGSLRRPLELPPRRRRFTFDSSLDGPRSRYTDALIETVKRWPVRDLIPPRKDKFPVGIQCYKTKGKETYIGIGQSMVIHAPLAAVDTVLADIDHYADLFPGYKDIHIVSRDANRLVTYWEQRVPVFFIPNVKYEMWYLIDHSRPARIVYRYQLKKAGHVVKESDGVIIIESLDKDTTSYTEFDFWDAEYGLLAAVGGANRIWKDSVELLFRSDLAILLKAENPTWSYEKIREEAEKSYKGFPIEEVLKDRRPFPGAAPVELKD